MGSWGVGLGRQGVGGRSLLLWVKGAEANPWLPGAVDGVGLGGGGMVAVEDKKGMGGEGNEIVWLGGMCRCARVCVHVFVRWIDSK